MPLRVSRPFDPQVAPARVRARNYDRIREKCACDNGRAGGGDVGGNWTENNRWGGSA